MADDSHCPIWGTHLQGQSDGSHDGKHVDSPRAGGKYFIGGTAQAMLGNKSDAEKARLTSWLIDQRRLGEECPVVSTKSVEEATRRRPLSPRERADRLLRYIASALSHIAEEFRIYVSKTDLENQRRLAWSECVHADALRYLMDYLENQGWIEKKYDSLASVYQVSVDGHARLAALEQSDTGSSKAFVAMWFNESTTEVWEQAIRPGIEEAGYEALRIDRKEHINKIDDEIVAELRRARFIVADFTHGDDGPRGGVYYEAGFAHGRGIPVIFSCRKDLIDKIHFDTRQYNHIVWEPDKLDEFRHRLRTRICAVVGDGPVER